MWLCLNIAAGPSVSQPRPSKQIQSEKKKNEQHFPFKFFKEIVFPEKRTRKLGQKSMGSS